MVTTSWFNSNKNGYIIKLSSVYRFSRSVSTYSGIHEPLLGNHKEHLVVLFDWTVLFQENIHILHSRSS